MTVTCKECDGRCVFLERHGANITEVDCEACDGKGEVEVEDDE